MSIHSTINDYSNPTVMFRPRVRGYGEPDNFYLVRRPVAVRRTSRKNQFPAMNNNDVSRPVNGRTECNSYSSIPDSFSDSLGSVLSTSYLLASTSVEADLDNSGPPEEKSRQMSQDSSLDVEYCDVPSLVTNRSSQYLSTSEDQPVNHGATIIPLDENEYASSVPKREGCEAADRSMASSRGNSNATRTERRRSYSLPVKGQRLAELLHCPIPQDRKMYSCVGVGPEQRFPAKPILRKSYYDGVDANLNPIMSRPFEFTESRKYESMDSLNVENQDLQNINDLGTSDEDDETGADQASCTSSQWRLANCTQQITQTDHPLSPTDSSGVSMLNTLPKTARSYQSRTSTHLPSVRLRGKSKPSTFPVLTKVCKELRKKNKIFDQPAAIDALKRRIIRGEKVTYEEIKAIRKLSMIRPIHTYEVCRLPWTKEIGCDKGLVYIPTPNKPLNPSNSFGKMEDLRIPAHPDEITLEHYGRRQFIINLAGFEDHHISLYLEGKNRLVIRAQRHDGLEDNELMSVTESVILPRDLPPDNLRIVRRHSGTTIIEESWRF